MQFRRKHIPAWVLLLVILGGAAAAVAVGSSGATVLTGDTQVAVADKLIFKEVAVEDWVGDYPARTSKVVHLANDRQSYMVNFIADEGDTIVIRLNVQNLAGIATVVKIVTDAPEYFDIGYSLSSQPSHTNGPGLSPIGPYYGLPGQLGNTLRYIEGEGWVMFLDANAQDVYFYQHIWIKTKPPTPPGQYTIMTWIEQKFQE
jgi:hypothetical protein